VDHQQILVDPADIVDFLQIHDEAVPRLSRGIEGGLALTVKERRLPPVDLGEVDGVADEGKEAGVKKIEGVVQLLRHRLLHRLVLGGRQYLLFRIDHLPDVFGLFDVLDVAAGGAVAVIDVEHEQLGEEQEGNRSEDLQARKVEEPQAEDDEGKPDHHQGRGLEAGGHAAVVGGEVASFELLGEERREQPQPVEKQQDVHVVVGDLEETPLEPGGEPEGHSYEQRVGHG